MGVLFPAYDLFFLRFPHHALRFVKRPFGSASNPVCRGQSLSAYCTTHFFTISLQISPVPMFTLVPSQTPSPPHCRSSLSPVRLIPCFPPLSFVGVTVLTTRKEIRSRSYLVPPCHLVTFAFLFTLTISWGNRVRHSPFSVDI